MKDVEVGDTVYTTTETYPVVAAGSKGVVLTKEHDEHLSSRAWRNVYRCKVRLETGTEIFSPDDRLVFNAPTPLPVNDRYTDTQRCVDRLLKEYKRHGKLIVCFDCDDTFYPYHDKTDTHHRVWSLLRKCEEHKFHIVVYTASTPDRFDMMRSYLTSRGITVASINENPFPLPFGNHGKIYYNLLLCDRAGLGQACETLETFFNQLELIK